MEIKAQETLETDYWCSGGVTRAALAYINSTQ